MSFFLRAMTSRPTSIDIFFAGLDIVREKPIMFFSHAGRA